MNKSSVPLLPSEELAETIRSRCATLIQNTELPLPILWLLQDEPTGDECEHEVKEIEPVIYSEEFKGSSDRRSLLLRFSTVTQAEIREIATVTVGQMTNPLYCRYKICRLTASNFAKILSAKHRRQFCTSLFKRLTYHHCDFDQVSFYSLLF